MLLAVLFTEATKPVLFTGSRLRLSAGRGRPTDNREKQGITKWKDKAHGLSSAFEARACGTYSELDYLRGDGLFVPSRASLPPDNFAETATQVRPGG